jgi:AbrB family looped-hinge helix DNA binding protein
LSYTVTEKGTVTIPVKIRKKLRLRKGSKVKFVETEEGALLVPAPSFEELRGVIAREIAYKMIKELEEERRQEAIHDEV